MEEEVQRLRDFLVERISQESLASKRDTLKQTLQESSGVAPSIPKENVNKQSGYERSCDEQEIVNER